MPDEVDHWQTPYERGMMCATCRNWRPRVDRNYGECGKISDDGDGDGDGTSLAWTDGPEWAALYTLSLFSCSLWGARPPE